MVDFDLQLAATLGRTTLDAAAAGWMVFDYINSIDQNISFTFSRRGIAVGAPQPFCTIKAQAKYIDLHLTNQARGNKNSSEIKSIRYKLKSMADMPPDLRQQIARFAANQL